MTASPPAAPGMPSEGEIIRLIRDWQMKPGFDGWDAKVSALASDIADLIRPAFEAKEREIATFDAREEECLESMKLALENEEDAHRKLEAAEAKLAQAVEALRQIKALKPQPIADTGFATGPLALLNAAQRIARDELRALRSASAAARRETTTLASGKETP